MNWFKKNGNGLIVGIVSTILCAFLFRIGNSIISWSSNNGYSIIGVWQNYLFRLAAKQDSTSFTEVFLFMVFGVFTGAVVWLVIKTFRNIDKDEIIKRINESGVFEKETDKLSDKEIKLIKRYNSLKTRSKDSRNKADKYVKRLLYVFVFLLLVLIILMTSCAYYPSQLWKSFELDITQITPYTEESTIKKLRSDWVSMTNKDDYISICEKINLIKSENGLN